MDDYIDFGQKVILAVMGSIGVVIVGFLTWISARGKNAINAGKAANDAAINIINELQEERMLMRIEREAFRKERLEWDLDRSDYRNRLLQCEGLIRGMEQYIYSLENLLRTQGIDIPQKQEFQPIFILDSVKKKSPK